MSFIASILAHTLMIWVIRQMEAKFLIFLLRYVIILDFIQVDFT